LKKETTKLCYLCGSTQNLTRDHIPPGGFFPTPRPKNLITVPCCLACNNDFSKDDEAVRLWLSAHIDRSQSGERIWEERILKKTFYRSPALIEQLRVTLKDTHLMTSSGAIDAVSYEVDGKRIKRFMIRITKGLLTHYFPDYDYTDAVFESHPITCNPEDNELLNQIRSLLKYDSRGDDVFQFRFGLTDTKLSGLWLWVFYGATLFLVTHTKNNWGKPGR